MRPSGPPRLSRAVLLIVWLQECVQWPAGPAQLGRWRHHADPYRREHGETTEADVPMTTRATTFGKRAAMTRRRGAVAVLVGVASLALAPQSVPRWPTAGWPASTLESEGLKPGAFEALDRDAATGAFGNLDRLFVTRHGRVVFDRRYPRDYREISRGR